MFIESIESVKCVDEGVIESVADANIGSIFGIGFPAWSGGVLQYINGYDGGPAGFVARARELAATYGERFDAAGVAGGAGRARRHLHRQAGAGRRRLSRWLERRQTRRLGATSATRGAGRARAPAAVAAGASPPAYPSPAGGGYTSRT